MKVTYVISDINKALAFEWIAEKIDQSQFPLSFILLLQEASALEDFLKRKKISCTSYYYQSKKDFPRLLVQVYRQLKRERPDVVHCHLLYGALIGLAAARMAGIQKRIYTRHHSDYHQRYFPKGMKWDKWCNRLATRIVAPSAVVKEVLVGMEGVPPEKVTIIHHGFDLSYFSQVPEQRVNGLKEKYQTEGCYPVVGVISRFTELKGIQYIIPAFQRVLKEYPHALLMLFGAKGDYDAVLRRQLQEMDATHYRVVPFEHDLAAVYRLFDVFVQVSTDRTIESFGQTYVEALASKVPSVFTLAGIAPDFIRDGQNAFVVPYKNADAIYEKIMFILHHQEEASKAAGQGAKDVERLFSLDKMIHSLEDLYAAN